jgi:hypothetical protein
MIGDRPELYHLPADCSRRDDEIEGTLAPRLHSLRPPLRVEWHDVLALAEGAAGCRDFHSLRRPQIAVLPVSGSGWLHLLTPLTFGIVDLDLQHRETPFQLSSGLQSDPAF